MSQMQRSEVPEDTGGDVLANGSRSVAREGVAPPAIAVEVVEIGSVRQDPNNARLHPERNLQSIVQSLKEFGQQTPIVVDCNGVILKGNGTWEAAVSMGWTHIAVSRSSLTGVDAAAYSIADNRTCDLSEFDMVALANLLPGIPSSKVVGFTERDIAEVMHSLAPKTGLTDADFVPDAPVVPITQPGDMWILGEHRLLCGDARVQEHIDKLFEAGSPYIMVTDPPYGVDYDPTWRHRVGINHSHRQAAVQNDDIADWSGVWRAFPGKVAYVWHGGLHSGTVQNSLLGAGFLVRSQIVWVKPRLVISRGHYHWQHEPCFEVERPAPVSPVVQSSDPAAEIPEVEQFCDGEAWYAVKKGATAAWSGGRKQTTVWEIGFTNEVVTRHGTQKPVECFSRPIRNHGGTSDIVFDPFVGSGTCLIACEMLGRKCVAMEVSPDFVDLAVERWQQFTGRKATLVSGAVPYDAPVPVESAPEVSLADT